MIPVFWDLETCCLSKDLAPDGQEIGWDLARRHWMGVAWAVTWSLQDRFIHWAHRLFALPGLQVRYVYDLPEYLAGAEHVFDYSGTDFDRTTLQACVIGEPLRLAGHTDVLASIIEAMERHSLSIKRPSLHEVGQATIREGKSGHGSAAPDLFRRGYAGDQDALYAGARYCQRDVGVLRDLAYHISRYGYCVHPSGQVIPVSLPGGVAEWDASEIHPRHALWRNDPITAAQVRHIRRWYGGRWEPTPGLTKGQASDMIEALRKEGASNGNRVNSHDSPSPHIESTPTVQNAATASGGAYK